MMMQPPASQSWIVTFVIVIIVVGVLLGTSLAGTDLLNFNRSAAEMHARDQATAAQAKEDDLAHTVNKARIQNEIATIESNTRAPQQAVAVRSFVNMFDQMIQLMRRFAEVEVQRKSQQAQIESQHAQQMAQIQASQQEQAQQRQEHAARTAQELQWNELFNTILAFALILMVLVSTAIIVFGAVALIWSRLWQTRPRTVSNKIMAQSQPMRAAAPGLQNTNAQPTRPQHNDAEYWKEKRRQARANEAVWRETQRQKDFPQGLDPVNYQDLPLAGTKNGSTNNDANPSGRARSS
jgi:hypothetical protein